VNVGTYSFIRSP